MVGFPQPQPAKFGHQKDILDGKEKRVVSTDFGSYALSEPLNFLCVSGPFSEMS